MAFGAQTDAVAETPTAPHSAADGYVGHGAAFNCDIGGRDVFALRRMSYYDVLLPFTISGHLLGRTGRWVLGSPLGDGNDVVSVMSCGRIRSLCQ